MILRTDPNILIVTFYQFHHLDSGQIKRHQSTSIHTHHPAIFQSNPKISFRTFYHCRPGVRQMYLRIHWLHGTGILIIQEEFSPFCNPHSQLSFGKSGRRRHRKNIIFLRFKVELEKSGRSQEKKTPLAVLHHLGDI